MTTAPDLLQELEQCFPATGQRKCHELAARAGGRGAEHRRRPAGGSLQAAGARVGTVGLHRRAPPRIAPLGSRKRAGMPCRVSWTNCPPGKPPPPAPGARPFTILLVEDNARRGRWSGSRWRATASRSWKPPTAARRWRLAERESPDLAIVDLNLGPPGPDSPSGFESPATAQRSDARHRSDRRSTARIDPARGCRPARGAIC